MKASARVQLQRHMRETQKVPSRHLFIDEKGIKSKEIRKQYLFKSDICNAYTFPYYTSSQMDSFHFLGITLN